MWVPFFWNSCCSLNHCLTLSTWALVRFFRSPLPPTGEGLCKRVSNWVRTPLYLRLSRMIKGDASPHVLVVVQSLSCVWLFCSPWTVTHQASLSMVPPRQEYCSGLPFPSPGDLLDPRIEPMSPGLADEFFTTEPPGETLRIVSNVVVFFSSAHRDAPSSPMF